MAKDKNFGDPATPWKKGDRFSASHLNEVVAIANRFAGFSGGEDIDVGGDPKSTNVSKVNRHRQTLVCVMQIVGTGPNGESDFTNQLYWGKRQSVDPSIAPWVSLTFIDNSPGYATNGTDFADIYPDAVENLGERIAGTHAMTTNGLTYVLAYGQSDDKGLMRWTCDVSQGSPIQGGLKYQVLMTVDNVATVAWDYPRFA